MDTAAIFMLIVLIGMMVIGMPITWALGGAVITALMIAKPNSAECSINDFKTPSNLSLTSKTCNNIIILNFYSIFSLNIRV